MRIGWISSDGFPAGSFAKTELHLLGRNRTRKRKEKQKEGMRDGGDRDRDGEKIKEAERISFPAQEKPVLGTGFDLFNIFIFIHFFCFFAFAFALLLLLLCFCFAFAFVCFYLLILSPPSFFFLSFLIHFLFVEIFNISYYYCDWYDHSKLNSRLFCILIGLVDFVGGEGGGGRKEGMNVQFLRLIVEWLVCCFQRLIGCKYSCE